MRILITGGAGFIGSNLSLALVKKGYKVTVLDNLSPQVHGENPEINSSFFKNISAKVNFIKGDVTNSIDLKKSIEKQDVIIHLAAETGTGQSMYEIEKYTDVNVLGTAKMLDVLVNEKHQVKKVVIASSRAVYGEGKYFHENLGIVFPNSRKIEDMEIGDFEVKSETGEILQPIATDENAKLSPISVYAITKQVQEQMVMTVCPTVNIQSVSLRFQNVYGEGQSLKNPYTGILSIFSTQILNEKSINIFEDGKESRDFIHIDDAVEAIIKSIETEEANGEIFNIGTGISTSVLEVAETLKNLYQKDVEINVSRQFRLGDIRHNFADITKAKAKLKFEPKISFEEGIKRFSDWVMQQNISELNLEKSFDEMKSKGLLK